MSARELNQFIAEATLTFRKGAEVTEHVQGGMTVTEVYAMPHESEADAVGVLKLIDVHFMKIGFTERAVGTKDEFTFLIRTALGVGEFVEMGVNDLLGGPSYITIGGWLGSQDLALRFIALGEHYGLWTVITPASLGVTDEDKANDLAGRGFVMLAPKPELREAIS